VYDKDASLHLALRLFSVMIISFLCGIHWAGHLLRPEKCQQSMLIFSNIITLLAFMSIFFPAHNVDLIIQSVCFLLLLCVDFHLYKHNIFPSGYITLRRNATFAVILTLLGVAFAI